MSLKIRLARAGSKKRPFYHIVVADSRSPRDGRFIERLGFFSPLTPKDQKEHRLKLDLDKVKAWIAKGAQPTDRVLRFLDEAGVMKREPRNNPEKAKPKKKAQERAAARQGRRRRRPKAAAKPRAPRRARCEWPTASSSPQIGAAHGMRGEVRLRSFTADPLAVKDYGALESEDGARTFTIESAAARPRIVSSRGFAGIADRTAAERLRNTKLYVRARAPAGARGR